MNEKDIVIHLFKDQLVNMIATVEEFTFCVCHKVFTH